jgi:hypothetical protein
VTTADRKSRNQRATALTYGVMAEVLLGTALLVWSGSLVAAGRAVFGPAGSVGVVVIAMVLLAVAMVVIFLAPRLDRRMVVAGVAAVSLAVACVGVMAIATVLTDPGIGFLLGFGWVLTMPVALAMTRAGASPSRGTKPAKGRPWWTT